jgi:hypothetical protein
MPPYKVLRAVEHLPLAYLSKGKVKKKVEPFPLSLSAQILPSCRWMISELGYSPIPKPKMCWVWLLLTR